MWKPSTVVDKHQRRATVIWMALLATICAYTIWLVVETIHKRENPSTSLTQSNQLYDFPDVKVCFFTGSGCDNGGDDECVSSAVELSSFYYMNELVGNANYSTEYDHCVQFNLASIDVGDGEQDRNIPTMATISMNWYPAYHQPAAKTYLENVFVYLGDSAGISIPYSRVEINSEEERSFSYVASTMSIGLTERDYLDGHKDVFYYATTISTKTGVAEWDEQESIIGYLYLDISQDLFSRTIIKEISPLEIAELLGSIGGFWEILLLTWGVFFITTASQSPPSHKGRDFAKPFQRGLTRSKSSRTLNLGINQTNQSSPCEKLDAQPAWDEVDLKRQGSDEKNTDKLKRGESAFVKFKRPTLVDIPRSSCRTMLV